MDNRIFAIFIVLSIDLLATWLLWSKVFEKNFKVEIAAFEKTTLRFFGMPILAGIALLLLFSFLDTILTGPQAARFLNYLFRFTLVSVVLSIGVNGLLHALFVWPQRNETTKIRKLGYFLTAIPALAFLALGILLLIKFFQFH
jgi:hypothetical protein